MVQSLPAFGGAEGDPGSVVQGQFIKLTLNGKR